MAKYFCENLFLKRGALKMAYICKKTKKVCPRVRYGINGEASPDTLFTLKGCGLLKKELVVETKKEEIKEVAIVVEDVIETPEIVEEKIEEVKEIVEEVEVKVEQKTNTPKPNNYKKKKKNYNQNKNQEQK